MKMICLSDLTKECKVFIAIYGNKCHLDKLINDESCIVRCEVTRHGYKEHLDKLVKDRSWFVRHEVARYGHKEHLDQLVDDEDEAISALAISILKGLK